jgi:hypothetical protein
MPAQQQAVNVACNTEPPNDQKLMRKIFLTLLISSVLFQSCKGQSKSIPKEIVNKDFNWRIQIPEGFESVPAEQWAKMQNKGADAIEKTYNAEVENNAKTIFVFKSDQFNYFESNYQPFDSKTDGDYLENFRNVNNLLYGTFEAQMPNAKLDSTSAQETINGKRFQTFKVTISFPNKMVMDFLMYSRLFENREFTVNIMTVDKEKQRVLLQAWRNSKFGSE